MTKSRVKKFVVVGPHRVHETKPGEEVSLDPNEPGTHRLLARRQIAAAPSRQQSADVEPTPEVESV